MHVLITGGSSGIGFALARLYAGKGARLSLIARNEAALERAREALRSVGREGSEVFVASADVTDDAALADAINACAAQNCAVDLMIASAGVVDPAPFDAQPREVFDRQIKVNLLGVTNAVRAVYPAMKQRGRGRILIISSAAGLVGCPGYAAYCASKSALVGFAEALHLEACRHGVGVSICYPPDTVTPQFEAERLKRPADAQRFMGKVAPWNADDVAEKIVRDLEKGRRSIHFGARLACLSYFGAVIKPALFGWHTRAEGRTAQSKPL